MKTLLRNWLIGTLVLFSASSANAGPFGNLRSGQELMVQCEARGCFHWKKFEFVFTRAGQVHAEVFACDFGPAGIAARRRLGIASLVEKEVAALDASLEAFVEPDDKFSTESVLVRLRLKSPGEPDRLDRRMRYWPSEKGALGDALFELAQRVEAAGAQSDRAEPIWQMPGSPKGEAIDAWLQETSAVKALDLDYEVKFVCCGDAGPGEPVMRLRLVPRGKQMVDEVEWEISIVGRAIVLPEVRSVLLQANRRLEEINWLRAWKAHSLENKITLHLRGSEAGGTGMEISRHLQPVWKHSGLQGEFRWRVTASRQPYDSYRRCSLDLLIGDADPRVLLVNSHPPMPSGWSKGAPACERVETGWDRKDRTFARYAIIQDGRIEMREAVLPVVKW